MNRTLLGLAALWLAFFAALPAVAAPQPVKPNIVFILSDDYGLDGVGCYGSDRFRGKTPNLDQLAATGCGSRSVTRCRCAGPRGA